MVFVVQWSQERKEHEAAYSALTAQLNEKDAELETLKAQCEQLQISLEEETKSTLAATDKCNTLQTKLDTVFKEKQV